MIIMATSMYNPSMAGSDGSAKNKTGIFAKLGQQFVEQRMAKARAVTADFLSHYSDEQLESYGWSKQDVKRLRNK
jgi:hypothetical protein